MPYSSTPLAAVLGKVQNFWATHDGSRTRIQQMKRIYTNIQWKIRSIRQIR